MRISVQIAIVASAVSAGCCADRCAEQVDCCQAPVARCAEAPGRCVVNPSPTCAAPVPVCAPAPVCAPQPWKSEPQPWESAPEPAQEPAPAYDEPPVEPAPGPPPATARKPIIDEFEPETVPVSTTVPDSVYGRHTHYAWLKGRLQRVHVPGGEWKLRYAPLDQQDRWGGSVILATDVRLDAFADGDIVYIEGEILAARPSLYLSGPLYRVRTIRKVTASERIARQPD